MFELNLVSVDDGWEKFCVDFVQLILVSLRQLTSPQYHIQLVRWLSSLRYRYVERLTLSTPSIRSSTSRSISQCAGDRLCDLRRWWQSFVATSRAVSELLRFSSDRRRRLSRICNIMSGSESVSVVVLLSWLEYYIQESNSTIARRFCAPSASRPVAS